MRDDSFENLLKSLQWNQEQANIVCSFIDDLTDKGFEHYMAEYYHKIHGFTTTVTGWFDDKWIDVKGVKMKEGGWKEYLIVQCKKQGWAPLNYKDKYFIGENVISQFYGKVADKKHSYYVRLIYAVTKDVTKGGKVFCQEKNIELITYSNLTWINAEMNLNDWIEAILVSPLSTEEKEKIISKDYLERRRLLLWEKEKIVQESKRKIAIEKDLYISKEQKEVWQRLENRRGKMFAGFCIFALICWLIIYVISAMGHFVGNLLKVPMKVSNQQIEVISKKNNEIPVPTRKKNIQKSPHNGTF